jgi:hypothetical protein
MEKDRRVIIREPDDPLTLRASIGGNEEHGYYLVFRGDPEKVLTMLKEVVDEAGQRLPKRDYADKRFRPQG